MLRTNIGYRFMLIQCYREYSEENILAWKAIEAFQRHPSSMALQAIYEKYIKEGAELMVNIGSLTRKHLTDFVASWRKNETQRKNQTRDLYQRRPSSLLAMMSGKIVPVAMPASSPLGGSGSGGSGSSDGVSSAGAGAAVGSGPSPPPATFIGSTFSSAESSALLAALPTILDGVHMEIMTLLQRDSFKRFHKSILFQAYLSGAQPPMILKRGQLVDEAEDLALLLSVNAGAGAAASRARSATPVGRGAESAARRSTSPQPSPLVGPSSPSGGGSGKPSLKRLLSGKGTKAAKRPAGIDTSKSEGTGSADAAARAGASQPGSAVGGGGGGGGGARSGRSGGLSEEDKTSPLALASPPLSPTLAPSSSTGGTSLMDRVRKAFRTPPTLAPQQTSQQPPSLTSASAASSPTQKTYPGLSTTMEEEGDQHKPRGGTETAARPPAAASSGSGPSSSSFSASSASSFSGPPAFSLAGNASPPTTGPSSGGGGDPQAHLAQRSPKARRSLPPASSSSPASSPRVAAPYSSLDFEKPDTAKTYPLPLRPAVASSSSSSSSPPGSSSAERAGGSGASTPSSFSSSSPSGSMMITHASGPPPTSSRKALKLLQGQSLRETRPLAVLPMLRTLVGYRFMLAFLYANRQEVPLLAWKTCEIFSHYASLAALTKFWSITQHENDMETKSLLSGIVV